MKVFTYDTTLRDGTQGENVSFSVDDKLMIVRKLDDLGIDYIEGGWPGSNPRDKDFFDRAKGLDLKHARIAAFGSTHYARNTSYHGPYMNLLPDLTARWSGQAPLDEVRSPGYGTVVAPHRDRRTGGHAEQGILIVRGAPEDMPLHLDDACGKDLAPTALHLLGVPVPENMEGRSLLAETAPSLTS